MGDADIGDGLRRARGRGAVVWLCLVSALAATGCASGGGVEPARAAGSTSRPTGSFRSGTTASTLPGDAPLCDAAVRVRDISRSVSALFGEVLAAANHQPPAEADAITARVVADLRTLAPAARQAYADLTFVLPEELRLDEKALEKLSLVLFDHLDGVATAKDFQRVLTELPSIVGPNAENAGSAAGARIDAETRRQCGISIAV